MLASISTQRAFPAIAPNDPNIVARDQNGSVKWYSEDKGFGFITPDKDIEQFGEKDLFVHFSGIAGEGFRTLPEGAGVTFDAYAGKRAPMAVNVRLGRDQTSDPKKGAELVASNVPGTFKWFSQAKGYGFIDMAPLELPVKGTRGDRTSSTIAFTDGIAPGTDIAKLTEGTKVLFDYGVDTLNHAKLGNLALNVRTAK